MSHGIFSTIRRQVVPFSMVLSIGLVATVAVILFAPRSYQSNAKLLLKIGRENVALDPTITTAGETMQIVRTRDSEVNTALQAMSSRTILERVVDEVGEANILRGGIADEQHAPESARSISSIVGKARSVFAKIDPIDDRERAIITLEKNLDIDAQRGSSVVSIHYTTKTPELAKRVTEAWVHTYLAEHARMNATKGSLRFFQMQEEQLLRSLNDARDELQKLKSNLGIITVEGKQTILQGQLEAAQKLKTESQAKLAAAKARLAALARLRAATSEKVVTSEAVSETTGAQDRMRDRLYELEIEERRLASLLTADHPAYKAVSEQLSEARRVYDSRERGTSEVTEGINPMHVIMAEQWSVAVSDVEALTAEGGAAEESIHDLLAESKKLNSQEGKLAAMTRRVEVLETQFRQQYSKREQARLADALEEQQIGNVNLIQPATLERRPVSPNKKLCGIVGLFGSLLAAVGIATIREARYAMDMLTSQSANEPESVGVRPHMEQPIEPVDSVDSDASGTRLRSVPR